MFVGAIRFGLLPSSLAVDIYPFYRAMQLCSRGLESRNSARPSVRLSITRVLCDKTKQCTADILMPHERAITLVF